MLADFGAEDEFTSSVCGKRCYNAVLKAQPQVKSAHTSKKRIPWRNDGPNTSKRYRGGYGQSGETKQTLAGEIVAAITDSGIMIPRTPKDAMNKILGQEASFRVASDWLNNTGQGVYNAIDLRTAVLHRCLTFYQFHPVMDASPTTQPLLLNTRPEFTYRERESDSSSLSDEDVNESSPQDLHAQRMNLETRLATSTAVRANNGSASSATLPRQYDCGTLTPIATRRKSSKRKCTALVDHAKSVTLEETQLAQYNAIEVEK
ncbi:hypothetical protein PHMEG_0003392 [Phytophthora megakarya]|uniref:Uncharacterized protein n=1 Tax=Phytophthora megakarya TaxID=4795 RepID=A0A225WYS7_9STRA|nr:hypothetical protein PHMEG_0003392 [Phytophthora megakarya]